MIKEFVVAWDTNKDKLMEHFRTHPQSEYCDYVDLVKLLFTIVINPVVRTPFNCEDIVVLDHGDYQGTQLFILHEITYQPSVVEYVYTNSYYGSCSGCDTLQAIQGYEYDIPNDSQVRDYMQLCLGLLQSCNRMVDAMEDGLHYKIL